MARRKQAKPFEHVPEITTELANEFVDALFDRWDQSSGVTEAISESGAMTWPDAPDSHVGVSPTPEQVEYLHTQDLIVDEIEELLRPAIAEAFREAATKVLRLRGGEGAK